MADRIVFLDIDGVLNDTSHEPRRVPTILPDPAEQLNRIIDATGCRFVLSSSWRCMVYNGTYTLERFEQLMRRSIGKRFVLAGLTPPESSEFSRGDEIRHWLRANPSVAAYCVLDDGDDGISASKHPFVRTASRTGLTLNNAINAMRLLGSK